MISYNPKNWLKLIFGMHRSQLMRYLAPNILAIGALTAGIIYLFRNVWLIDIPREFSIHTIVGIVLGLVLVFRTNTAYDRWWEGRRAFGSLTNSSRNLALKLDGILAEDDHDSRDFYSRTIHNFYVALKEHLRGKCDPDDLDLAGLSYQVSIQAAQHRPAHIVAKLQQRVHAELKAGKISPEQYLVIMRDIDNCMEVAGICERIRNTPIPFSYSTYIKKVIFFYLATLPLSMVTALGYWAVPMIMFATYVIAGIEVLAEEIEDPFGTDANDLDTDGMARNIRKNIREILIRTQPEAVPAQ